MTQIALNLLYENDAAYQNLLEPVLKKLKKAGFDEVDSPLRLVRKAQDSRDADVIKELKEKIASLRSNGGGWNDILTLSERLNKFLAANKAAESCEAIPKEVREVLSDIVDFERDRILSKIVIPVPESKMHWIHTDMAYVSRSWSECIDLIKNGHALISFLFKDGTELCPEVEAVFTRIRYVKPYIENEPGELDRKATRGLIDALKAWSPEAAGFKIGDSVAWADPEKECPDPTGIYYGRRWGISQSYLGGTFLWGTDTTVKFGEKYCRRCDCDRQVYQVNFSLPPWRDIQFCLHCNSIVHKPKRLGRAANGALEVVVEYQDGSREASEGDFCAGQPVAVYHCGEPMPLYLQTELKNNVIEEVRECPVCRQEKLLKHFKAGS